MEPQILSFPILFTSIFFIILLKKIWKKTNSKCSILPPGPTKLPFIGNLHQFIGSLPHYRLQNLSNKYGTIMEIQLGEVSNIVISSAEGAKQVLKTHDLCFCQRPFQLAASIITYNFTDILFSPHSDYWRQMKKICILELLSPKRVQSFRSIREEEVSNLINIISSCSNQPFNFSKKLFSSTYGIVARVAFGEKRKEQEEFIKLSEEIISVAGGYALADFFPSIKFLRVISGLKFKLLGLREAVDKIFENIISDHKARRKARKMSCENEEEAEEEDLVDVLLRIQENGDLQFPLTNENIKAVILDIFTGGSETSSTTVEWAMSEMLRNPKIMKKAQEEVRRVTGKKGNVDETDLQELNYLKLVIKETLRLHSPAPLRTRECRESCEINGYEIPAKTRVIINVCAIGRDPNYWEEAETFYPERFIDNSIDFKGNHFEFLPFGAGRRICPGISFGMVNVELQLAKLLYHFDWKLPDGLKLENLDMTEAFGATVRRKNDLQLIAIPYQSQNNVQIIR